MTRFSRFLNGILCASLALGLAGCAGSSTADTEASESYLEVSESISPEVASTELEEAAAHAIIGCNASYFPSSETYSGLPGNVRDGYLLIIALEDGTITQDEYISYESYVEQYRFVNEVFLKAKVLDSSWSDLAEAWETSLAEVSDAYANGMTIRDATYSVSESSSSRIDASCDLAFSAGVDYATQAGLNLEEWLSTYFEKIS
jgi:hypothetical protein